MATEAELPTQDDVGRVNRRNLLKGAVATGVGVVAWSSPSITSIGMTPAYAATCTGGSQMYFLGGRNTSCNCTGVDGTGSYVEYKNPKFDCAPEERIATPPRSVSHNLPENGNCPEGTTAQGSANDAAVIIGPRTGSDLEFCTVTVIIKEKNMCLPGNELATASGNIVGANGGTVKIPKVVCSTAWGSDIFFKLYVECAADEACLY